MVDILEVTKLSILGIIVISFFTFIGMSAYENTTSSEPNQRPSDKNMERKQLIAAGGKSRKLRTLKSKTRRLFR